MADSERRAKGAEVIKQVYAGDVVTPPEGASDFCDIMLEQLFAEVWTRDVLSMRDRRLLLLGAIMAQGEGGRWAMVLVRVFPVGFLGIREALLGFQQGAGGLSYEAPRMDLATNSATLVGFDRIENTRSVSRVTLVDGLLYDLRAAFSPDVSSQIKEELNEIVNSFQMLD